MPAKPSLRDRVVRAFRRRATPTRTPPALRRQLERLEDRTVPTVTLNSQFSGLNLSQSGGFVPPDTCGAAGSGNTYVETVNQTIALYNKTTGAQVVRASFTNFLVTQGGLPRASGSSFFSDPIVVFDEHVGRFIVGDQDVDFGSTHVSRFDLAVSKTANPATLTTADWTFFQVNTTENLAGGANGNYDADYPGNFGYNRDVFVFTLNMFPSGSGTTHVQVNAVDVNSLLGAGPTPVTNRKDVSDVSLRPTVMHDAVAGDPMWLIGEGGGGGTSLHVVRMDNPNVPASTAFTTFTRTVSSYVQAVAPRQPSGTSITTNIDSRIMKAAEANNTIVASHAVSISARDRDLARWYRIDVSNPANPVVADQGNVTDAASGAGGAGVYDVYPVVDINPAGVIGMTFTQSGTAAGRFMSAYVTGRLASDLAGTMQAPVLVQAGGSNNSDGREGDLSGINVDADGTFWAAGEVAGTSSWSTAISHFTVTAVAAPPTAAESFGAVSIPLGGTASLTFTITNPAGNSTLTGIGFTDSLPAGLVVATPPNVTGTTGGGTVTANAGSGTITLSGASLAAGASLSFSVSVTGTTAGVKNNSVTVSSTEGGSSAPATASVSVVAPPTAAESFGAPTIPLNGSTSLTFTITNPSAGTTLTGLSFTDNLPAGLVVATPNGFTLVSGSLGGGTITADPGSGTISLTGGSLAAGASVSFSVNVTGATAGVKNNSVVVASAEGGSSAAANASVTVVAPPSVVTRQVNDGSAQRSRVIGLTVAFSGIVTLPANPADAFALTDNNGNAVPGVTLNATVDNTSGVSVATITFSGLAVVGGSLPDGRYVLTALASQVTDSVGQHPVADDAFSFFRFFGDFNGDARVDNLDFAMLKTTFNAQAGDANYLFFFDYNGDGKIDNADLGQFKNRLILGMLP